MDDDVAEVADGERRGGAGEDGVRLGEFVKNSEEFEFHFEFFGDGFDDELGVADGFVDDLGGGEAGEGSVTGGGVYFAAADAFFEGFADPGGGFGEHGVGDVFEDSGVAAEGGSVGDAAAHGAGADDGDGFDLHGGIVSKSGAPRRFFRGPKNGPQKASLIKTNWPAWPTKFVFGLSAQKR